MGNQNQSHAGQGQERGNEQNGVQIMRLGISGLGDDQHREQKQEDAPIKPTKINVS